MCFFCQKSIDQLFDYLLVFFLKFFNFLELQQQFSVLKLYLRSIRRRPFDEIITGNTEGVSHSF